MPQPFHAAIPVRDLDATLNFYTNVLGCGRGRSSEQWADLEFFGHQLVLHISPSPDAGSNPVDGHDVPVPHYGVVLEWGEWERLSNKLVSLGTEFIIDPYIRFKGEVGEQATMFFKDPSGNALEFKAFKDPEQLFAT